MKKCGILYISVAVLLAVLTGLCMDLYTLQSGIIRFHVIGASNSEDDQHVKLLVRDAVLECLEEEMTTAKTPEDAIHILHDRMPMIEQTANEVLKANGFRDVVTVHLNKEAYPRRDYENFSLPAGVYQSLRICIGEAEGRNWWCVVFPSFCFGAVFDEAVEAGFSRELTQTITRDPNYELRFFILDYLGQLQNFFLSDN